MHAYKVRSLCLTLFQLSPIIIWNLLLTREDYDSLYDVQPAVLRTRRRRTAIIIKIIIIGLY